jgi:hypothetical protein
MKFIITSEQKEQFTFDGKSLGVGTKRAIFYNKKLGKKRNYRQDYESPSKGMVLLTFLDYEKANNHATAVNDIYNDDFVVEQI